MITTLPFGIAILYSSAVPCLFGPFACGVNRRAVIVVSAWTGLARRDTEGKDRSVSRKKAVVYS